MRNDPVLGFHVSSGTALVRMELAVFLIFQSTHPVRGGTDTGTGSTPTINISIHPPLTGWDGILQSALPKQSRFQSTHPVRGGTFTTRAIKRMFDISIHPPREGWDISSAIRRTQTRNFNPPTP